MLLGVGGIGEQLVVAATDVIQAFVRHWVLVFSCAPGIGDGFAEILYGDAFRNRGGKAEENADEGLGLGGLEGEARHFLHHGDYRASHFCC